MDLFALSSQLNSVNAYSSLTKRYSNTKTDSLWQQRKDNGIYEKMAQENPALASAQEQIDKMYADTGSLIERLSSGESDEGTIQLKVQMGQKLSAAEMEKLKEIDPQAYAKAKMIEAEQAAYERKLRQCRTKEDVERLRMTALSSVAANVQSIANNPHIPDAKKMELLGHEQRRATGINEATAEFAKTAEYANLPTEAERNEEYKAEREAREAQLNQEKAEETKPAVDADEGAFADSVETPDGTEEEALPELPGQGADHIEKTDKRKTDMETKAESEPFSQTNAVKAHDAYKRTVEAAKQLRRRER